MMKIKIFAFIAFISLVSCESETYVNYTINNESTKTIYVQGNDIIHALAISDTIASGNNLLVASWSKRGKETNYFEPTSIFGEDLVIVNSDGDTMTKDYKLLSNWSANVDDAKYVATHDYNLYVSDTDF